MTTPHWDAVVSTAHSLSSKPQSSPSPLSELFPPSCSPGPAHPLGCNWEVGDSSEAKGKAGSIRINLQWTQNILREVKYYHFFFFCPWEYSLVRARGRNWTVLLLTSIQFSSVPQSCLTLSDPTACSMPGFPVHHQLPELAQTHVHWVGDAIPPSHPISSPSSSAFNLSQLQGLFQWVSSSHQVTKVLEFQLQHQSFQRIFSSDFL